jgi:glycosyltransferase involved in cell wall biosynthesis
MDKVSVIIPTYNCAKFIKRAIDSALSQTYQNIEIIVVDDGSTDNTGRIIEGYGSRIKYFYQDNSGLAKTRNRGLREASGKYLAFLDADDYWLPQKLELQLREFNDCPEIGLVHCAVQKIDEHGNIQQFYYKNNYSTGNIFYPLLLRKTHIASSAVVFKQDCVKQLGYLDESMKQYGGEDREFMLRICKKYSIRYIDNPLVMYTLRNDSLTCSRKTCNMIHGRHLTVEKATASIHPSWLKKILKNRALSAIYLEFGYESLAYNKPIQALCELVKSILYWPFYMGPYKSLSKVFLPQKLRELRHVC